MDDMRKYLKNGIMILAAVTVISNAVELKHHLMDLFESPKLNTQTRTVFFTVHAILFSVGCLVGVIFSFILFVGVWKKRSRYLSLYSGYSFHEVLIALIRISVICTINWHRFLFAPIAVLCISKDKIEKGVDGNPEDHQFWNQICVNLIIIQYYVALILAVTCYKQFLRGNTRQENVPENSGDPTNPLPSSTAVSRLLSVSRF